MTEQRQRILAELRSWLGVPYKVYGRSRWGVDCVGLFLVVFNPILGQRWEYLDYSERLRDALVFKVVRDYADRIPRNAAQPGDIVIMNHAGRSTHIGILSDRGVVHADIIGGKVVEHGLGDGAIRIASYYCVKGVD